MFCEEIPTPRRAKAGKTRKTNKKHVVVCYCTVSFSHFFIVQIIDKNINQSKGLARVVTSLVLRQYCSLYTSLINSQFLRAKSNLAKSRGRAVEYTPLILARPLHGLRGGGLLVACYCDKIPEKTN